MSDEKTILDWITLFIKEEKEQNQYASISTEIWQNFNQDIVCEKNNDNMIKEKEVVDYQENGCKMQEDNSFLTHPENDSEIPQKHNAVNCWEDLNRQVLQCKLCPLHKQRQNSIIGEGNPHAKLLFIGDCPSDEENLKGHLFEGKAGLLLEKMITAMNLTKEEVYLTHIVKCRPYNGKTPELDECESCIPFLLKQIELIKPEIIVLLGSTAVRHTDRQHHFLGSIDKLVGNWMSVQDIPAMPIFHPAYLVRLEKMPEQMKREKRRVWDALQLVMKKLSESDL